MSRSRGRFNVQYKPTAAEKRRREAAAATLFPSNEQVQDEAFIRAYRAGKLSTCTPEELEDLFRVENK